MYIFRGIWRLMFVLTYIFFFDYMCMHTPKIYHCTVHAWTAASHTIWKLLWCRNCSFGSPKLLQLDSHVAISRESTPPPSTPQLRAEVRFELGESHKGVVGKWYSRISIAEHGHGTAQHGTVQWTQSTAELCTAERGTSEKETAEQCTAKQVQQNIVKLKKVQWNKGFDKTICLQYKTPNCTKRGQSWLGELWFQIAEKPIMYFIYFLNSSSCKTSRLTFFTLYTLSKNDVLMYILTT
jgi:hypothetical protein